ncbi:MAG: bacteriohemerythrin [Gemmatimonadales bacterium]|nr:bacteriohemerythrin [Gemmatimonadales bacterium]
MALIDWTGEFSVGIKSLDEQHQNLVEIINKFDEARRRGKGSKVMGQILNEILGYTQEHFAFEEKLLEKTDFPGRKLHQSQHRQLLQKVERLQHDFLNEDRRITAETSELFDYWLTSHILKHDKEYSEHLQKSAVEV